MRRFAPRALVSLLAVSQSGLRTAATEASSSSGHRRGTFHPFNKQDEEDLVKVITTKPRHVLKHVRQQVWRSRKRELHFRNTVTQLMIVVQDHLRKNLLEPEQASQIMEGVLEECVKFSQHDMAHLLFRAFLRFRKYGCTISIGALRSLFDSYKGTDNAAMMLQLASEMKDDAALRPFCIAAYLFAGHAEDAEALRASIPLSDITSQDMQAMIEGYAKLDKTDKIMEVLNELPSLNRPGEEWMDVFRSALRVFFKRFDEENFNAAFKIAVELKVPFDSPMFASLLRVRVRKAGSLDDIVRIEEEVKGYGYVPDMTGNSILISGMARLAHYGDRTSEEIMLGKVNTLLSSVEARLQQGDADLDISGAHIRAVIRGYGAAGRPENIKSAWTRMASSTISKDTRVYNELLKWYSLMGNVKDVLQTKEEMSVRGVHADAQTYAWVFRVLGKYYPRQVEVYYQELVNSRVRPDIALYTTLIGVFGDLEQFDRVEDILDEVHRREQANTLQVSPLIYAVMMRVYSKDLEKVEALYKEAVDKGVGEHTHVTTTMLHAYAAHSDGEAKLEAALAKIPQWDTNTFNVMINMHGRRNQPEKVKELLKRMRDENIEFNDVTFGTLVTAFGRWKDTAKVQEVIEMLKEREGVVNANFYSILASTYARLGDKEGINDAWEDLQTSKLFPDTEVYNQFLSLYSRRNDVGRMQRVMSNMLEQVPPNPLTATTIVDMLGKSGRLSEMESLFKDMQTNPDTKPTSVTFHQMMNAYAKTGDVAKMERLREEMLAAGHVENHVTFNILADGYGRAKRFEQLVELMKLRSERGIPMDELGYCVVIAAYGRVKLLNEIERLASELRADSTPGVMSRKVMWVLVDAFTRCGDAAKVQAWIDELKSASPLSNSEKTALISYYCRLGLMDNVEAVVKDIEDSGTDLALSAMNSIARGYAKAGQFDKCVETLHRIRDRKLVPDASTTLTLSNAFIKAGLHQQAQQIVQWRRQHAKGAQPDEDDLPTN